MSTEDTTPAAVPLQRKVGPVAEARWCVEESATGMPVAQGCAMTAAEASREAMHYAVQYAQDGPVRWWVRQNRKTVVRGSIAGATITRG